MTLYRCDLQWKIPTELVNTGVYYWTNVWYWNADTPDEYDFAHDWVVLTGEHQNCDDVRGDRIKIVEWPSNVLVQQGAYNPFIAGFWGDSDGPITNVLLYWLYAGEKIIGYKRVRMPVPSYAHVNGVLTPEFYASYSSIGLNYAGGQRLCNSSGVEFTHGKLDPLVHGWQLRHGTRRAERRYLHP